MRRHSRWRTARWGGSVAGVDQAGSALAGCGTEAARFRDRRGQRQDVLHVGVRPQQRVRDSGGSQARLDLCLPAPPCDGRVSRGFAGRLDDVPSAGAGGAGDDVQFLGGHGRADQHHGADARHCVVNGGWHVQVAFGDLRARLGQRRGLRRVAHQNTDGHVPPPQQADCLGADLPGRSHKTPRPQTGRTGGHSPPAGSPIRTCSFRFHTPAAEAWNRRERPRRYVPGARSGVRAWNSPSEHSKSTGSGVA